MDLKSKSATELRQLAKQANKLANDLEKKVPTYALALEAGVTDVSYQTKGSKAGVALRMAIIRLAKPPKQAANAIDSLGLAISSLSH